MGLGLEVGVGVEVRGCFRSRSKFRFRIRDRVWVLVRCRGGLWLEVGDQVGVRISFTWQSRGQVKHKVRIRFMGQIRLGDR